MVSQELMAKTSHVANTTSGYRHKLGEYLTAIGIAKRLPKSEPSPQLRKDRPIGLGFTGGWSELAAQGHPPFRIGHHPLLLTPLGGRQ